MTDPVMQDRYRVNAPAVVSETIDGEAVIMNLRSGNYYSIRNAGAILWDWVSRGHSLGELIDMAQQDFSGDPAVISTQSIEFVQELLRQELVVPAQQTEGAVVGAVESVSRGPFQTPELEVHSDMQDLLLLDPIHDVDAVGWPSVGKFD